VSKGFKGSQKTTLRHWLFYGALRATGLLCLGLYLLIFWPTSKRIANQEAQLEAATQQISVTGFAQSIVLGEHLADREAKLAQMQTLVDELSRQIVFFEHNEDLLETPFRVLEFEQRYFDIQQSLGRLAATKRPQSPVRFMSGLPSYSTTTEYQNFLWLHLEFFNHVMVAFLSSGEDLVVERVESLPVRTLVSNMDAPRLFEVRLKLSVKGSADALAVFLNAALPQQSETLSKLGRKAYEIDRIDLKLEPDETVDHISLDVLLTGFVLSEDLQL
jgi:hypothetical protein